MSMWDFAFHSSASIASVPADIVLNAYSTQYKHDVDKGHCVVYEEQGMIFSSIKMLT